MPRKVSEAVYLVHKPTTVNNENYEYEIVFQSRKAISFKISKTAFDQLMVICYLTCTKEISRRMASENYFKQIPGQHGHYGKNLPFGMALFRSLRLIEEGHIRLGDVFSENAPFGISTGISITLPTVNGLKATKDKLNELNKHFIEYFYEPAISLVNNFNTSITFLCDKPFQEQDLRYDSEQDHWSDDDREGRPKKVKAKVTCLFQKSKNKP